MVDVNLSVPSGVTPTLRSVTAEKSTVTVYSNAGLTAPVTLPYTLSATAPTTLYLGEVGQFRAVVTDSAGTKVLGVGDGSANGSTALVFRPSNEGAPDLSGTYALLRKARAQRDLPVMARPYVPFPATAQVSPRISSQTSAASTGVFAFGLAPSSTFQGVVQTPYATIHGSVGYATDSSSRLSSVQPHGVTGPSITLEFLADSPKFELTGTFGLSGLYIWANGEQVYGLDTGTPWTNSFGRIEWGGVRALRHYRIMSNNGLIVSGFTGSPLDTFLPADITGRTKVAWLSDSYAGGFQGLAWQVDRLMGWDVETHSLDGGTGYITAGSAQTFATRVPDVVAAQPDVIVVAGGLNDSLSGLQAGATSVLGDLRTGCPNAPIFVVGPWCPPGAPYSSQATKYAAIQAAQATVTNSFFIDPHAWFTGTGNTSSPTGDGNADVYINSDNTHLNAIGTSWLAGLLANAFRAAMAY